MLPGWLTDFSTDQAVLLSALVGIVVMLVASVLGAAKGASWHRRVDRALLAEPEDLERVEVDEDDRDEAETVRAERREDEREELEDRDVHIDPLPAAAAADTRADYDARNEGDDFDGDDLDEEDIDQVPHPAVAQPVDDDVRPSEVSGTSDEVADTTDDVVPADTNGSRPMVVPTVIVPHSHNGDER
jgi:hypothetical protein